MHMESFHSRMAAVCREPFARNRVDVSLMKAPWEHVYRLGKPYAALYLQADVHSLEFNPLSEAGSASPQISSGPLLPMLHLRSSSPSIDEERQEKCASRPPRSPRPHAAARPRSQGVDCSASPSPLTAAGCNPNPNPSPLAAEGTEEVPQEPLRMGAGDNCRLLEVTRTGTHHVDVFLSRGTPVGATTWEEVAFSGKEVGESEPDVLDGYPCGVMASRQPHQSSTSLLAWIDGDDGYDYGRSYVVDGVLARGQDPGHKEAEAALMESCGTGNNRRATWPNFELMCEAEEEDTDPHATIESLIGSTVAHLVYV
jgi:hypothetical protein